LQRRQIVARGPQGFLKGQTKAGAGPFDHELDVRCKVHENGSVAADPETLRLLGQFSEREIEAATGTKKTHKDAGFSQWVRASIVRTINGKIVEWSHYYDGLTVRCISGRALYGMDRALIVDSDEKPD